MTSLLPQYRFISPGENHGKHKSIAKLVCISPWQYDLRQDQVDGQQTIYYQIYNTITIIYQDQYFQIHDYLMLFKNNSQLRSNEKKVTVLQNDNHQNKIHQKAIMSWISFTNQYLLQNNQLQSQFLFPECSPMSYLIQLKRNQKMGMMANKNQFQLQSINMDEVSEIFNPKEHFHFGATVYFSCSYEKSRFYMYSNGISFKTMLSIDEKQQCFDPKKCLFFVTPVMKYQAEDVLKSILMNRYTEQQNESYDPSKMRAFIDQFEYQLWQNNKIKGQQFNFPIKYHQNFMLQHVFSSKYLCYTRDVQSNELVLQLTEVPNSKCIFNLRPCYSYQKDINTYIPFSSTAYLNSKEQKGFKISEINLYLSPKSIFSPWVFSEESQDKIKIQLYQIGEQFQYKNICFGDAVWIFHLESGSFLKNIDDSRNIKSIVMEKIKYSLGYARDITKKKEIITQKLVAQKVQNEMSAQKFGLWQILYVHSKQQSNQSTENSKFVGGRVKFNQQIRFLNLKYSSFLGVRKIKKGRNKYEFQFSLEQNQQQNTIFIIKSLYSGSDYVTTEDLFLIQNVSSETYFSLSTPFPINQTQVCLSPSLHHKKEDNFKFTKVDFANLWQNNTLLSIIPFLSQGIISLEQINSSNMIYQRDNLMLKVLYESLIQLLSFSFDLAQGFEASDNKLGKTIYNHFSIQKLLREQGIIKKVIKILQTINPEIFLGSVKQEKQQQSLKMIGVFNVIKKYSLATQNLGKIKADTVMLKNIVNISFKFLRNCCKSNTQNSLLLFNKMDTIIKYLSLGTYAQNFLMDSFSNSVILQKITADELKKIINQYINVYKKTNTPSKNIFELLTRLVRLNNRSISKNQLDVYHLFLNSQNPLLIPIKQIDRLFFIKNIELNQYCTQFPDIANILGWQIKFCSELTADRNYICSKTIKKWFPLQALFHYLISHPVKNEKIQQSFIWILINSYLNERPRFKRSSPLVFNIANSSQQEGIDQYKSTTSNYEIQMKIMQDEGLSASIIQDIFSCIREGNQMSDNELQKLKKFIVKKIEQASDGIQFYTSRMQAYLYCFKYLVELQVFKNQQNALIEKVLETAISKIDSSYRINKTYDQKLESQNFREILLEMLQKNVIRKYNQPSKNDGIEQQIKPNNICLIYVNYSFYQNILLQENKLKQKKINDSVLKIVMQLIKVFEQIKKNDKINKSVTELISTKNHVSYHRDDKQGMLKLFQVNHVEDQYGKKKIIFNLFALLFYNSNTFEINSISLHRLIEGIFSDRLSMEKLTRIQFNVDSKEVQDFNQLQKLNKNIKILVETSEVWLNTYDIIKNKHSKFDAVILLFINKIKRLLKIMMPDFKEDSDDPLFCQKYIRSIVPEKQQIIANLKIHEQIIDFVSEYRTTMLKIKSGSANVYNILLPNLFKYCYFFLYAFICQSPENKNQLSQVIIQSYVKDYFNHIHKMDFGQTIFITKFLKNNYEQCVQFYGQNPEAFQKYQKYTATHSRLLLTLFSYYKEPIIVNLKKFYLSIFDLNSFRTFLWFKPNTNELNLDISLFKTQFDKEPFLYHIHALQAIIKVTTFLQQSRNTIKQHIRKCLSQEYLFSLLMLDDFYTKENSNNYILRVMIHFKSMIMKIIQFTYFSQLKNDNLILNELRRQNSIVTKFINEAPARQQNQDFRKVFLIRELKEDVSPENNRIRQLYENNLNFNRGEHILQTYLNAIDQFCMEYKRLNSKSNDDLTLKMVQSCQQIHQKVVVTYQIIHKYSKNAQVHDQDFVQKYPLPYEWLFSISSAYKDEESVSSKRFYTSFLVESIFSSSLYQNFAQNEKNLMKIFQQTLQSINLKQMIFLRKLSEYVEDAFEKLSNRSTNQMFKMMSMLMKFLTLWIQSESEQKKLVLRDSIGKSQLIFPILNYFQTSGFDKMNKQLFLVSLEFFNELIGQYGDKTIQGIFNEYFNNKSDSIEFFMKIKHLFDAINFQDKVNYKSKKIYDSINKLSKDCQKERQPQFIILNFLIRLCKGSFTKNQIFLSGLSSMSNFNIMSGIWDILKSQSQKYKKNLINSQNYHLIYQCFSTIRQLVEGPCTQNQNQFLKKDFFLTVLDYFQYEYTESKEELKTSLQSKLIEISKVSSRFAQKLRIYLNQDKITNPWMISQVKYLCINLICSLLSQNANQQNLTQLFTIPIDSIIKQIDKVYLRFTELDLKYNSENLEIEQNKQIILPLGFKLYELLQYYPKQKIPEHSPGLDFFQEMSRKVQVIHQNLCVVVFPRIPEQISQSYKIKFLSEIDRSSVNSKLKGLQDAEVQNRQSDHPYGYFLFVVVALINILDLIESDAVSLVQYQYFNLTNFIGNTGQHPTVQVALLILLTITIILSIFFFILELKGAVYFRHQIVKIITNPDTNIFRKVINILKFLWESFTYFHYLIVFLLSALSLYNPFFNGLLLLVEIYRRSQTFSIIVDAITSTLDQLFVVLLLYLVCTYLLTAFMYFYRASTDYADQCTNLYHCFVFSLDMGFRADAAIVGFLDDPDTILDQFATQPLQDVIVNFIYLLLIKLVIDQIIGAVIVDKFAALRQNQQKIDEDENSLCFICGLDRNLLDRDQDGFQFHKRNYHNVWNYFQFLIHLRKSNLKNLTAIQLFVYDQQKNGKLNWFPINRSFHMESKKNLQGNDKNNKGENQLQKMMKLLDQEVNELRQSSMQIWNLMSLKMVKSQSSKS